MGRADLDQQSWRPWYLKAGAQGCRPVTQHPDILGCVLVPELIGINPATSWDFWGIRCVAKIYPFQNRVTCFPEARSHGNSSALPSWEPLGSPLRHLGDLTPTEDP